MIVLCRMLLGHPISEQQEPDDALNDTAFLFWKYYGVDITLCPDCGKGHLFLKTTYFNTGQEEGVKEKSVIKMFFLCRIFIRIPVSSKTDTGQNPFIFVYGFDENEASTFITERETKSLPLNYFGRTEKKAIIFLIDVNMVSFNKVLTQL